MGFKLEFHAQRDGTIVCARYEDNETRSYKDQFSYHPGSPIHSSKWRKQFDEETQLKMTRAIALSLVLQKEGHN